MGRMTYVIAALALVLIVGAALFFVLLARRSENLPELDARIGDARLRVELAASALARARGLGYRDALGEDRGMLFSFGRAEQRAFWMKGMRFPIDIVWLRDGVVVDVTADVPPQGDATILDLKTYRPSVPSDEVLEVNAGYAAAHAIVPGARLVVLEER